MQFDATPIAGLWQVTPQPHRDERGSFARLYGVREFAPAGPLMPWRQVNLSRTRRAGTVRGLHVRHAPYAEAKLVRCLRGRVFDVAVDLRPASPTCGQWHAIELAPEGAGLLIPPGCAHGFQTLVDDCELLYLHEADYRPEHEGGVSCDDLELGIDWPLPLAGLSARDRALPGLRAYLSTQLEVAT